MASSVTLKCGKCTKSFDVPEDCLQREVNCPFCFNSLRINLHGNNEAIVDRRSETMLARDHIRPSESDVMHGGDCIEFNCPHCSAAIEVAQDEYSSMSGKAFQCPSCANPLKVPVACAHCGQLMSPEGAFCDYCGKPRIKSPLKLRQNNLVLNHPVIGAAGVVHANPASTLGYAGFWKRFAASILDAIITAVGGMAVVFAFRMALVLDGTDDPYVLAIIEYFLGVALGWIYFAVMESSSSQGTPGKLALGIRVTDLNGNRISFGKATGRYFGKILSSLILLFGYLMVAFTEKKQGLHDMMAGCLVVNK